MTTTTISNIAAKAFTGNVEMSYIATDPFALNWMTKFGPEDAENLNQPWVVHGDPKFIDDDSDHRTYNDSSFNAADIPLFNPLKLTDHIKRKTTVDRPGIRHLENLGRSHGLAMAKAKSLFLIMFLAKIASDNGNTVQADVSPVDSSSATNAKNGIKSVMTSMDNNEVDNFERYGIVNPLYFYELADQDGVMSKDFGTGAGDRAFTGGNGAGLNYLNCDIRNLGVGFGTDYTITSTYGGWSIPSAIATDLSNVVGVFWQKRSWAVREQEMVNGSIDWLAQYQVWQALTRYEFGCKEIFTDGIWAVLDSSLAS